MKFGTGMDPAAFVSDETLAKWHKLGSEFVILLAETLAQETGRKFYAVARNRQIKERVVWWKRPLIISMHPGIDHDHVDLWVDIHDPNLDRKLVLRVLNAEAIKFFKRRINVHLQK
ncbi:MAG: hypothetical protein KKC75_06500 [Nanoarchaeota archaeon]|nr:hypothetical protein [Nanoarchaeota archaeon]MBU1005631.1 hypothetical protein [Nanoarchaeota archaeon]MBU1946349.1 hypothetical protein [Nanoarchaeota archaeon]